MAQVGMAARAKKVQKAKKAKSDGRVVTYVRVPPNEHEQIRAIALKRGYPHTIASVASELISKSLAAEAQAEAEAAAAVG